MPCRHKNSRPLFLPPPQGDTQRAFHAILGGHDRYVVCPDCGARGLKGRSRVRWCDMGDWLKERADKWNADIAAESK